MRTLLGGLILFCLAIVGASAAGAQVTGRVEMIGLDGRYRPGCWTPMLVRLQTQGSPTGLYELRVYQHDLDGDTPYFSTRVTLTAGRGEQGFWTYFLPEPIHGGLTTLGGTTIAELQQRLRITVNDATGRELVQLPVGNAVPESVDPVYAGLANGRASRFVVFVNGTGATPPLRDYEPSNIAGLQEDLTSVILTPDHLPESALGYDGVDAIVWLDGDPAQLSTGGSRRLDAIREYVERGGHLVIGTPPQRQQLAGFGDLLPVTIDGTERNNRSSPTRELANDGRPFPLADKNAPRQNPWDRYNGGTVIATARPVRGSVVDRWADRVDDPQTPDQITPWLVRKPVGDGCVSWVGQDLGARELSSQVNWGWPRVWEAVLGTASQPVVFPDVAKFRFQAGAYRDLGATVLDAMNLTGRAATLVGVTVLFFIAYWFVAGPGTYFLLRYRGRSTASWFAFGAVALGATAVTLAVVRVVLRGAPDVKHVTLVRVNADPTAPAMAISRLGVYVPRDGPQAIALAGTDPRFASTITPYPIHPTLHARRDGDKYLFPAPIEYAVSVPTGDESPAPSVAVPFRTTMKRLRADWFGAADARIGGTASLRPTSGPGAYIAGALTNDAGVDLRNVYVAFRHQSPGGSLPIDYMMYVASWPHGGTLDLGAAFNPSANLTLADITVGLKDVAPNDKFAVRGTFKDWRDFFAPHFRAATMGDATLQSDLADRVPFSVPILSFFEQFPPIENAPAAGGGFETTRADLHRTGLRDWDVGNALIAGQLVIVAQADNVPVPIPLTIAGDKVEGTGTTIYQFILPLAPIPDPPATMPATSPTTSAADGRR